uniref:Uncharacterized protein n=1 Tax=Zooxanthella nutricula TaxID=1333877 RepID=A0A6U9M2X5_9DINO
MASAEPGTPKSARSVKSTKSARSARSARTTASAAERRLQAMAAEAADGAQPQLPNHRSAVFVDASPNRRGIRSQRTAMMPGDASPGGAGLGRQRTALLAKDIRPSRTAMLVGGPGFDSEASRLMSPSQKRWAVTEAAVEAKANMASSVANFVSRTVRAFR